VRSSSRLQIVDDSDLEFVGVHAIFDMRHFHIHSGTRPTTQLERLVERADRGWHGLRHDADGIKRIRKDR
jgi:hypothetical protein